ncbi:MAG: grasp-with-spasm system ATP-grasp peptide maturase [Bacteroidia bacterium]|nr:grasp-with-spasm system ATP-grasp peptide maturase [Bacteroidia bacterium]MBP9689201.1 grasp-with-spasm system ATP-grasp peptide maturase [Bacteroidia bacterium]
MRISPYVVFLFHMILINSSAVEFSTFIVGKWLTYLCVDYARIDHINHTSSEIKIEVNSNQFFIELNGYKFDFSKFKNSNSSYWYRRAAHISYTSFQTPPDVTNPAIIKDGVNKELLTLNSFLLDSFYVASKYKINHHSKSNLNRLVTFKMALNCGLKIPAFVITNRKQNVINFSAIHKKIVIKPISEVVTIDVKEKLYTQYTRVLKHNELDKLPDNFFPSLFMQYIEKSYEVRSFYLDGKFYSMAMFTQQRKQTVDDFRRYEYTNPVRVVPYKISEVIEEKIRHLFSDLNINSGSIDLLKPQDGSELVFLEINPVGQFGMVSHPCNYYLEKLIAQNLSNKKNEG